MNWHVKNLDAPSRCWKEDHQVVITWLCSMWLPILARSNTDQSRPFRALVQGLWVWRCHCYDLWPSCRLIGQVGSEERTTRTALFLQQQLYQEKQERCHSSSSSTASSCSTRIYSSNIWNTPHPTRGDCAANPAFQYGYKSPSASSPSQSCYSASPKSFRKTPGAKSAHPRYNRGCNQAPLDSTKLFQPMR